MSSGSGGQNPAVPRRFRDALERAQAEWAAADPAAQARRAGCRASADGVLVPYFGRPHLVTHPGGLVGADGAFVHAAVAVLILHYLVRADGTPPAEVWQTFRELPDGLFYAPSFTSRAEEPIAAAFGGRDASIGRDVPAGRGASGNDGLIGRDLEAFRAAALSMGGEVLDLADAGFSFQALPRMRLAALLWEGDEDFPAEAHIVFDATAGHYLPAEDLAGLGEALTRKLTAGR